MFFALQGNNFDGNEYVSKALSLGANHVICTDSKWEDHKQVSVVANTLSCLQKMANHHRRQFDIPVLALTGSNGKTTTKELTAAVLRKKYDVVATRGNLNNHIGVPLTLLEIDKQTEIAIIEMGANHQGEIAALCQIAKPNYGLITNFGKAHLEGFGGVEGVKKGKSELFDFLAKHNGKTFVVRHEPELIERSNRTMQVLTPSSVTLSDSSTNLDFVYNSEKVATQLTGDYNFNNALYAIAIGEYFGISQRDIINGLEQYSPSNNRSQILQKETTTFILDAYNANPSSMRAALKNLTTQKSELKKLAILGDMFEMGEYADREHQEIVDLASELELESIFIGENFFKTVTDSLRFKSYESFSHAFKNDWTTNKMVLLKGSRGMRLERILELIT